MPVYNEASSLEELVDRVAAVAAGQGWRWELVCVLDGCADGSRAVLERMGRPEVRVLEFDRNYGQHTAVFAGLEASRGRVVATMDADLQNPPEALPELVAAIVAGADGAAGWRRGRRDPLWRKAASRIFNLLMSTALRTPGHDWGCMLRAWPRPVVDRFLDSGEAPLYIPVQLARWVERGVELPVDHAPREHGGSRYTPARLGRLFGRVVRSRFAPPQLDGRNPAYRLKPSGAPEGDERPRGDA